MKEFEISFKNVCKLCYYIYDGSEGKKFLIIKKYIIIIRFEKVTKFIFIKKHVITFRYSSLLNTSACYIHTWMNHNELVGKSSKMLSSFLSIFTPLLLISNIIKKAWELNPAGYYIKEADSAIISEYNILSIWRTLQIADINFVTLLHGSNLVKLS